MFFFLLAGWGSHYDETRVPYMTAAAGIGMTKQDIELFIKRVDKVLGARSKEVAKRLQELMIKEAQLNSHHHNQRPGSAAANKTSTQV